MEQRQDRAQSPPLASPMASATPTTTTTTTTHGPQTMTTTSSSPIGQDAQATTGGPHSTTTTTTVSHPIVITTTDTPYDPSATASHTQQFDCTPRTHDYALRPDDARHKTHPPALTDDGQATPSTPSTPSTQPRPAALDDAWQANRRRSASEPRPPPSALFQDDSALRRQLTAQPLRPVPEDGAQASNSSAHGPVLARGPAARARLLQLRQPSALNMRRRDHNSNQHTMNTSMVDVLDVLDPEVSALTTLNNMQNSLFLPNIPWLYNRQPTYDLAQSSSDSSDSSDTEAATPSGRHEPGVETKRQDEAERPTDGLVRSNTIDSTLSTMEEGEGHHYAVLPHGASLPGWTPEEKAALDDHVRHLLHSRRARFKRTMRGFGRYCRNPLGLIVTLYFFLITFWGAAWVLFLIGWIYVGGRQAYFVEIADQILTALFCVVGITMFPFRIVDTYHMIFVAHFAHKTWRLRREKGLGKLKDHNELPTMPQQSGWEAAEDLERQQGVEAPVLTPEEQTKLEHHQAKLAKSHTFYRPHETYTHNAFSIRLLIAIVVLLDCHSMFQCALGGTTWGIYYKVRPKELTAIILSFSLTCNITAGILISRGDKRSRKTLIVEQLMRQEMTEEALEKLRKERGLKAKGLMSRKQKKKATEELVGKKKSPLDTILHRG